MAKQNQVPAQSTPFEETSYFDGGFFGNLGYIILVGLVSALTLGIAFPWMCCLYQDWKARHTVICGKRTYFDGKGHQLIGRYILWSFLTLITFGIYGFWMGLAIKKWITKHTHFQGEKDNNSYFDGTIWGLIGTRIVCTLLFMVTLGIGAAWAKKIFIEWQTKHTVIDSRRLIFTGTGGNLFGKYILWGFLTAITFSIFALWIPIKFKKWQCKYTIDSEHTTEAIIKRSEYKAGIQAQAVAMKTARVEDEMEGVKAGISDNMDKEALLELANKGIRSAQFEYVARYSEGNYEEEPYGELLKNSALQSYAPAMSAYGLSGLCKENAIQMISKAAAGGQLPCAQRLMRVSAQNGIAADDSTAEPFLNESVRWYDLLKESGEEMSATDTETNENCLMKLRRIAAKKTESKGAGKVLCIIALVIAAVFILTLIIGGAAMFLTKKTAFVYEDGMAYQDGGAATVGNGGVFASIGSLINGGNGYEDEFGYEGNMAGADEAENGGYYEEETSSIPEDVVLSNLTYDEFMTRLRDNLVGINLYNEITLLDTSERGDHYALICSAYYYESYFDLYVKHYDGYVASVEIDGPRVYETIDEEINGQEFQFLLKRFYEILGIGPNGEEGGVYIGIDPGTSSMQPFIGWEYWHNHTEDTLNTVIKATAE